MKDGKTRDPAAGIIGFTKIVAVTLLGAKISDLVDIPGFAALQGFATEYRYRWGPFCFGADMQHFAIEHASTGAVAYTSYEDIKTAEEAVSTMLSDAPSAAGTTCTTPWIGPVT